MRYKSFASFGGLSSLFIVEFLFFFLFGGWVLIHLAGEFISLDGAADEIDSFLSHSPYVGQSIKLKVRLRSQRKIPWCSRLPYLK